MQRPFSLRWTNRGPRLVWVERRRPRGLVDAASSAQVSAELEIALLAHPDAAAAMPHLVRVHDQLVLKGWPGLAGLPPELIHKALIQGQTVAAGSDAPALAALLAHLRALDTQHAADVPDLRSRNDPVPARESTTEVEVSELDEAEFEQLTREWGRSEDATPPAPPADEQKPPQH